jgi:hypothetical protein
MSIRTRSFAALPLAAALALGACGSDTPDGKSEAGPARLALSAREYSLDSGGVRSVPAGAVAVSLRNAGRQEHGLQIYRLNDGVTVARFMRAYRTGDEAVLPLVSLNGGVAGVPPGERWRMTLTLRPGTYVLEDFGETPNGESNGRDHGMVTSVRVGPSQRPAAARPAGTTEVSLAQGGCRVPDTLPRRGTLAISTRGSGNYEFALGRVAPDASARELRTFVDGNPDTFPNVEPVDLLSSIGGGRTAYVPIDLRPGTYLALCFIEPRPGSGAPANDGRTVVVR